VIQLQFLFRLVRKSPLHGELWSEEGIDWLTLLGFGRQSFGAKKECIFFDLCTPYLSTFLSESVLTLVLEGATEWENKKLPTRTLRFRWYRRENEEEEWGTTLSISSCSLEDWSWRIARPFVGIWIFTTWRNFGIFLEFLKWPPLNPSWIPGNGRKCAGYFQIWYLPGILWMPDIWEFYFDCTDLTFYVNIIQLLSIWLFCFINKSNMHQSYPKAYSISNVTLEFMVDRRRMLKWRNNAQLTQVLLQ
jgi:hypothetical protein